MNLDEAKALMMACGEINFHLNNVSTIVDGLESKEMQRALRTELGNAMAKIYGGVMRPVIKDFPELDPDADA